MTASHPAPAREVAANRGPGLGALRMKAEALR